MFGCALDCENLTEMFGCELNCDNLVGKLVLELSCVWLQDERNGTNQDDMIVEHLKVN